MLGAFRQQLNQELGVLEGKVQQAQEAEEQAMVGSGSTSLPIIPTPAHPSLSVMPHTVPAEAADAEPSCQLSGAADTVSVPCSPHHHTADPSFPPPRVDRLRGLQLSLHEQLGGLEDRQGRQQVGLGHQS